MLAFMEDLQDYAAPAGAPAFITLNSLLSSRFNFTIDALSEENALRLLQALLDVDKNASQTELMEQDIARMRQDISVLKMKHEQEMEAKLREIQTYKSDVMKLSIKIKQLTAQLAQEESTLYRLTKNYDEAISRAQTYEHANRKLNYEIDDVRKLVYKLQKSEKVKCEAVPAKGGFRRVEEEIRSLYRDIYQVELERPSSQTLNEAILAEAVAHVKKTYNEDMESVTKENVSLRSKLKELKY